MAQVQEEGGLPVANHIKVVFPFSNFNLVVVDIHETKVIPKQVFILFVEIFLFWNLQQQQK